MWEERCKQVGGSFKRRSAKGVIDILIENVSLGVGDVGLQWLISPVCY